MSGVLMHGTVDQMPSPSPVPSAALNGGYNETMLLRNLDDFLTEIRQGIQTEEEREEEELPAVD